MRLEVDGIAVDVFRVERSGDGRAYCVFVKEPGTVGGPSRCHTVPQIHGKFMTGGHWYTFYSGN